MDRFERLNSVATMDSVTSERAAAAKCPQCGYTGVMSKPDKKSMMAGLDSFNEIREELRSLLSERYGTKDTYVYVQDFGTDWVVFEVSGMDGCDYYSAPYQNTDNGLSVGAAVEVHQVWAPV
jgi:hypothetical protein